MKVSSVSGAVFPRITAGDYVHPVPPVPPLPSLGAGTVPLMFAPGAQAMEDFLRELMLSLPGPHKMGKGLSRKSRKGKRSKAEQWAFLYVHDIEEMLYTLYSEEE